MQKWAKYCRVGMWISLVVFGTMQWGVIIGILIQNSKPWSDPHTIWPMLVAMLVLTAAVIAYSYAKSGQLLYLIVAGLATFVIVAAALELWQRFNIDVVISSTPDEGLDMWELIYRHLSSALVAVFMLGSYILERLSDRQEMSREVQEIKEKNRKEKE